MKGDDWQVSAWSKHGTWLAATRKQQPPLIPVNKGVPRRPQSRPAVSSVVRLQCSFPFNHGTRAQVHGFRKFKHRFRSLALSRRRSAGVVWSISILPLSLFNRRIISSYSLTGDLSTACCGCQVMFHTQSDAPDIRPKTPTSGEGRVQLHCQLGRPFGE
jgi:hypothetical protein